MLYETARSREREEEIIKAVAAQWDCGFHKLPLKTSLDYSLERSAGFKAFAEVRDRAYSYEFFAANGGYMISVYKVERGFAYCDVAGLPFFVIVRCNCGGIYWVELCRSKPAARRIRDHRQLSFETIPVPLARTQPKTWRKEWSLIWFEGNRNFRRDDDAEPVFLIPMSAFGRVV